MMELEKGGESFEWHLKRLARFVEADVCPEYQLVSVGPISLEVVKRKPEQEDYVEAILGRLEREVHGLYKVALTHNDELFITIHARGLEEEEYTHGFRVQRESFQTC